jgi:hypothetical protein
MHADSSTRNLSHKRNSPPRGSLYQRLLAGTEAQRLLHKAGITNRDISDKSGVSLATVNRALSLRFCGATGHAAVIAVRRACETLHPDINAKHWEEYDHAQ